MRAVVTIAIVAVMPIVPAMRAEVSRLLRYIGCGFRLHRVVRGVCNGAAEQRGCANWRFDRAGHGGVWSDDPLLGWTEQTGTWNTKNGTVGGYIGINIVALSPDGRYLFAGTVGSRSIPIRSPLRSPPGTSATFFFSPGGVATVRMILREQVDLRDICALSEHFRFVPKAVIRLAIIARGTDNREHCEAARSVEAYSAVREPETG